MTVWNRHIIFVSKLFLCVSIDLPASYYSKQETRVEATLRSHCILSCPIISILLCWKRINWKQILHTSLSFCIFKHKFHLYAIEHIIYYLWKITYCSNYALKNILGTEGTKTTFQANILLSLFYLDGVRPLFKGLILFALNMLNHSLADLNYYLLVSSQCSILFQTKWLAILIG